VALITFALLANRDAIFPDECAEDTCSAVTCRNGGACAPPDDANDAAVCLCPLGFAGPSCEIAVEARVPHFAGRSHLTLFGLGAVAADDEIAADLLVNDVELVFKPETDSSSGLLLYNGERDGPDFLAVYLLDGRVHLSFDCGDGAVVVA